MANCAISPNHYKGRKHECREFTAHLNFNLGNAFKYLWRWRDKNGVEDLEKAYTYIGFEMESNAPRLKLDYQTWDKADKSLSECGFDDETKNALSLILLIANNGKNHEKEVIYCNRVRDYIAAKITEMKIKNGY